MGNDTKCPTRLLDDTPAEVDAFAPDGEKIGPHRRVAISIADVIRSDDESGGKMIGLEGGWGAGKTTVVKFLAAELDGDTNMSMYVFDAWAHEGDPLRRTFLESLIRHFMSKKWLSDTKHWDNRLEELAQRVKTTRTTTTPSITTLGKFFAVSVLLVPLGAALLAAPSQDGIVIDYEGSVYWQCVFGFLFSLAPFGVILWNFGRLTVNRMAGRKSSPHEWAFLSGETNSITVQTTSATPDPTSIEFEAQFRELMDEVLPPESPRRAVVVLDNLDRVNPEDALRIWSTLQTFLQDGHPGTLQVDQSNAVQDTRSDKEPTYQRPWVVVPYDPSGLRSLWDSRRADSKQADDRTELASRMAHKSILGVGHEARSETVSQSFIDKSFRLRFEVSPLVLSNWKGYLLRLVRGALPENHDKDGGIIYRVYNHYHFRQQRDQSPTPRELKLYVNQIGAIHRQWQHEFPLGHVAYYVILRRSQQDVRRMLLADEFPDPALEAMLPPRLQENLAGLAFNVSAELGQQLLLGEPIFDALARNKPEEIERLIHAHNDGFWAVLEGSSTDKLSDAEPAALGNVGQCLGNDRIKKYAGKGEYKGFVRALGEASSKVQKWVPINKETGDGLAAVSRIVNESKCTEQLIRSVQATLDEPSGSELLPNLSEELLAGLVAIAAEVYEDVPRALPNQGFTLSIAAENWIGVCSLVSQIDGHSVLVPILRPTCKAEEIVTLLQTSIANGEASNELFDAVRVTQRSMLEPSWGELVSAAEGRLDQSKNAQGDEAARLLRLFSTLRQFGAGQAEPATERLVRQGHLAHCMFHRASQKSNEFRGWCLAMIARCQPGFEKPATAGQSEAGFNFITNMLQSDDESVAREFVVACAEDQNLNVVWRVVDEKGFDSLLVRSLKLVADGDAPQKLFTTEAIASRWNDLQEHLPDEASPDRFGNLIRRLCEQHDLAGEIQKGEQGFDVENAGLYLTIVKSAPEAEFRQWCCDGMSAVQADDWKNSLDKETELVFLAARLTETGSTLRIGHGLQDGIREHAKLVLAGTVEPSEKLQEARSFLVASLEDDSRRSALRDILLDEAIDRHEDCPDAFFTMYGDEIKSRNVLTKNDRTVAKLFSGLVREKRPGGLAWLAEVAETNPDLLRSYSDQSPVKDFCARISEDLADEESDEAAGGSLVRIAEAWGIEPREKADDAQDAEPNDKPDEKR